MRKLPRKFCYCLHLTTWFREEFNIVQWNVLKELVKSLRLKESFTIQSDKSTNVVNLAILLILVNMFMKMNSMQICTRQINRSTNNRQRYFSDFLSLFYKPPNWVEQIADGEKSLTGKLVGTVACIKALYKLCTSSHCILHRHIPKVKRMPSSLKCVLDIARQIS